MFKDKLTKQEIIIANLIVNGFSAKNIATKLFIEECTVKSHIHNIYSKYDLTENYKGSNDPSKRTRFVNIWNKEKYGDIDLILSQNRDVINQNRSLQKERRCLMTVILKAVKSCNKCSFSKNNNDCAEFDLKTALLNYTSFGGENEL